MLKSISGFFKNQDFRTFSLLFAIVYFTQMYGKLGFLISQAMFADMFWLSVLSAVIFGLFAGTATTALIVHNKQEDASISKELLLFDIVISCLFYLDVGLLFWNQSKFGAMAAIIAFAAYTSRLLYHLSEQFREQNLFELKSVKDGLMLVELVIKLIQDVGLSIQFDNNNPETSFNSIQSEFTRLQNELKASKDEATSAKSQANSLQALPQEIEVLQAQNKQLGQRYRDTLDRLKEVEERLSAANYELNSIKFEEERKRIESIISSKRGHATRQRNAGNENEAIRLENEIKDLENELNQLN